jgi:hypothetical protein
MSGTESGPQIWREHAACRNTDSNLFFNRRTYEASLRYCAICRVRIECRSWADESEGADSYVFGIYGGETPEQRKARRLACEQDREPSSIP